MQNERNDIKWYNSEHNIAVSYYDSKHQEKIFIINIQDNAIIPIDSKDSYNPITCLRTVSKHFPFCKRLADHLDGDTSGKLNSSIKELVTKATLRSAILSEITSIPINEIISLPISQDDASINAAAIENFRGILSNEERMKAAGLEPLAPGASLRDLQTKISALHQSTISEKDDTFDNVDAQLDVIESKINAARLQLLMTIQSIQIREDDDQEKSAAAIKNFRQILSKKAKMAAAELEPLAQDASLRDLQTKISELYNRTIMKGSGVNNVNHQLEIIENAIELQRNTLQKEIEKLFNGNTSIIAKQQALKELFQNQDKMKAAELEVVEQGNFLYSDHFGEYLDLFAASIKRQDKNIAELIVTNLAKLDIEEALTDLYRANIVALKRFVPHSEIESQNNLYSPLRNALVKQFEVRGCDTARAIAYANAVLTEDFTIKQRDVWQKLFAFLGGVGLILSLSTAIQVFVGSTAILAPIAPVITALTTSIAVITSPALVGPICIFLTVLCGAIAAYSLLTEPQQVNLKKTLQNLNNKIEVINDLQDHSNSVDSSFIMSLESADQQTDSMSRKQILDHNSVDNTKHFVIEGGTATTMIFEPMNYSRTLFQPFVAQNIDHNPSQGEVLAQHPIVTSIYKVAQERDPNNQDIIYQDQHKMGNGFAAKEDEKKNGKKNNCITQ